MCVLPIYLCEMAESEIGGWYLYMFFQTSVLNFLNLKHVILHSPILALVLQFW